MTSEEIEVNAHLEAEGVEVVETDLGEWVIQLAAEEPSHIVVAGVEKILPTVDDLQPFVELLGRLAMG